MQNHFIAYYQHIAKLAQVANKQTIFLAYVLYHMEFDSDKKQYYADLSTAKKIEIMKKVSPEVDSDKLLNLSNQYINKLKKADLIKSWGRGVWGVNPICYGAQRPISKSLREENVKVYSTAVFTKNGLETVDTKVVDEEGKILNDIENT